MKLLAPTRWMPAPQRIGAVLWISFLLATVATGVFFSAIDPLELRYCVSFPEVGRTTAYTVGFLLFWLLTASSALLSVAFVYPAEQPAPDAQDPS